MALLDQPIHAAAGSHTALLGFSLFISSTPLKFFSSHIQTAVVSTPLASTTTFPSLIQKARGKTDFLGLAVTFCLLPSVDF